MIHRRKFVDHHIREVQRCEKKLKMLRCFFFRLKGNQNPADNLHSVNAQKLKKSISESLKKSDELVKNFIDSYRYKKIQANSMIIIKFLGTLKVFPLSPKTYFNETQPK